jgi:hypothetical protein
MVRRGITLLTGVVGSRGRGARRWKTVMRQEGGRERESDRGGCLAPTDGRHPTGSGLRPVGGGGVVQPCRTAGSNKGGGGRLTGGPLTQWRARDG